MRNSVLVKVRSSLPSACLAPAQWRALGAVLSRFAIAAYAVAETALAVMAAIIEAPKLRSQRIGIRGSASGPPVAQVAGRAAALAVVQLRAP